MKNSWRRSQRIQNIIAIMTDKSSNMTKSTEKMNVDSIEADNKFSEEGISLKV